MLSPLVLDGRAAIITGAASGIGRSLALAAGSRGMKLGLADVDADGLAETRAMLTERRMEVYTELVDVRSPEMVESFAEHCFDRFSSVAAVFANAGVLKYDDSLRPDLAVWDRTIDVNLRGPVHCVAAFMGRMLDRGEPAQFVLTGSLGSFIAAPDIAAYCATKHGLWSLAESLHHELARTEASVGVSLLAPPRVNTNIIRESIERVGMAHGAEAAQDFAAAMLSPDAVAEAAITGAIARELFILPDADEFRSAFATRVAPLLNL
jgi:short-subunit dehydrogenase